MNPPHRRQHRLSMASDSSSSSSPERELDDDYESIMEHPNDSQSSLGVSLEEMELDSVEFERQCRISPISRLPAELLISVFSKLNTPADLQTCMLVCKTWARNSVDLLWYRPSTIKWKHLLSVIKTACKRDGFFAYNDLVKRLNLGQLKKDVSDGVLLSLSSCKRIERLTLPGCDQLTDLSVGAIINGNRSLMAIDVSDLDLLTDRTMLIVAENCFRLQGLNVSNCRGLTDQSLFSVARSCRRIKRLKLNDCSQITDFSVVAFADYCHDLLEIDLHRCIHVTDMAISALIHQCRQLRELRLAQCVRITDEAFLRLPSGDHFDALRILDLTDCNELQDAGLQRIVHAAPRLRNLVLAKCRNVTDRGLLAITRLGKNLHFLHLGHCANITDYGVSYLIRYCNRIRYIDFSCCSNLTDDSVSHLATLQKLKRIGLVKCGNITDESIKALARPKSSGSGQAYPSNLERLHLSYCTHLTIRGVRKMLLNCPQLTHLSLTGVPPFLREDLIQFCRPAPDEFNDHQRDVFCVFSGPGVGDLRNYLEEAYQTPADVDADDSEDLPLYRASQIGPLPRNHVAMPMTQPQLWQQLTQIQQAAPPGHGFPLGAPPQQQPDPPLGAHMASHLAPPTPAFMQAAQPFNALNPQNAPVVIAQHGPPPPPSPPSPPLNPHEVPMALPPGNPAELDAMEDFGEDSEMMGEEHN